MMHWLNPPDLTSWLLIWAYNRDIARTNYSDRANYLLSCDSTGIARSCDVPLAESSNVCDVGGFGNYARIQVQGTRDFRLDGFRGP